MESRKKRKKRSKNHPSKFKIRVRYKYHYYRWINTEDYGSFKDIYEKYKDKGYSFWCVPKGDSVFTNPGIESMGEQLDSVVSANGNYELPSRYFERDYAGELVVVRPFLLPETRLTPEHPVLSCESNPQKSKWYNPQTRPSLKKTWKPAGELTEKIGSSSPSSKAIEKEIPNSSTSSAYTWPKDIPQGIKCTLHWDTSNGNLPSTSFGWRKSTGASRAGSTIIELDFLYVFRNLLWQTS